MDGRFAAADRCLQHWHFEGIHEVACQVGSWVRSKNVCWWRFSGTRPPFTVRCPAQTVEVGQSALNSKTSICTRKKGLALDKFPRCDVLSNSSQRLLPFLMASLHARCTSKGICFSAVLLFCIWINFVGIQLSVAIIMVACFPSLRNSACFVCHVPSKTRVVRWPVQLRMPLMTMAMTAVQGLQRQLTDSTSVGQESGDTNWSGEALCLAVHWCWQDAVLPE